MRRKRKHPQHAGMSPFKAGLIATVVIFLATMFAFTKFNPIASPYELTAVFNSANNLKPNSPVRIAGVQVGKVVSIDPIGDGTSAARVEMQIQDKGLPIHEDARLKVRPRIFLEGNFFVEIEPGSPSAPAIEDGGAPIPATQTAAPVQFTDVLAALETDTRKDLKTLLREYTAGLEGEGAEGFNEALRTGKDAFRYGAIVSDATLGLDPDKDIQRVVQGQQKTFAALSEDEEALKGLVTNLNTTAGALAREDVALEAAIPALRDTLRTGSPALASLNSALPSLRAFAVDALPAARSSGPVLEAGVPFIRQARALVGKDELRATAAALRTHAPNFVKLTNASVPLFEQGRALSACTNQVLVPFITSDFPDPDFPQNTGTVNQKIQRGFVGLSGESRGSDANQSYFRVSALPQSFQVRPAPPTTVGDRLPDRRPDQPCENQQPPNLQAPGASSTPAGVLAPLSKDAPIRTSAPKLSSAKRRDLFFQLRDSVVNEEKAGFPQLRKLTNRLLKRVGLDATGRKVLR